MLMVPMHAIAHARAQYKKGSSSHINSSAVILRYTATVATEHALESSGYIIVMLDKDL